MAIRGSKSENCDVKYNGLTDRINSMKKLLVMCLCVVLCSVTLMACKNSSTDNSYKTNAGSEEYRTTAMQTEALKETAEETEKALDNKAENDTDNSESKEEQIEGCQGNMVTGREYILMLHGSMVIMQL